MNTHTTTTKRTTAGLIAAALVACVGTTTALAQVQNDKPNSQPAQQYKDAQRQQSQDLDRSSDMDETEREYNQSNRGEWEYSPEEGYNKEEWYDPTDWFDDEFAEREDEPNSGIYDRNTTSNNRSDSSRNADNQQRDNAQRAHSHDMYRYDNYYSSYYDGYHDGYYNRGLQPNSEHVTKGAGRYSAGFGEGYDDGAYDRSKQYDYDPYYYIIMTPAERGQNNEQGQNNSAVQRKGETVRTRGYRAQALLGVQQSSPDSPRYGMQYQSLSKLRGTVESFRHVDGVPKDDGSDLIVRVKFYNGDSQLINLGPWTTPYNMPFTNDERVTFSGTWGMWEDKQILNVQTLTANGRTARISGYPQATTSSDSTLNNDAAAMNVPSYNGAMDAPETEAVGMGPDETADMDPAVPYTQDETLSSVINSRVDTLESDDPNKIDGTVTVVSETGIKSDQYTIVQIGTQNGFGRLVALDPEQVQSVDELNIRAGDTVAISGRQQKIAHRSVLVADSIEVNGDRVAIRR